MAGGIFVDAPFHANPKCIMFGVSLMIAYWFLPKRNVYLLPFVFILAYIAMAWYDYMYNCSTPLYSGMYIGENTFDTWAKPQKRNIPLPEGSKEKLYPDQDLAYRRNVNLFHILGINMLIIYIGYKAGTIDKDIYQLLIGIASIALIYHGLRLVHPREVSSCEQKSKQEEDELKFLRMIYLFHVVFVVPLLFYVGIKGNSANKDVFKGLMVLGIVSSCYHLFRYYNPRPSVVC